MKNYEQYKRIVKFIFGIIVLFLEMSAFWYVWLNFYNQMMEKPYNRTGHWLMIAVYGILLVIFNILYGGLKIGYLRTGSIIYSQILASICANVMIYLQITLLTKHFQTIVPLIVITGVEFLIICIWSFLSVKAYRYLYPPRKVLLIYGERPIISLMGKIHTRNDRFIIGATVPISVGLDEIKKKIGEYEGVVICDIPANMRNLILKYCYGKSIRTYTIPKISDILLRSAESLHLFDTPLLLSRNTGLSFEQRFVKRTMDIMLSLAALIILSPIFIITAISIKLYDGGPVFYFQDRCTLNSRVFSIYKFRSMIVDAEKAGHSIPATDKDPRITPIGRIIRATRIDELPQILNILKGDMSIVGPRPERIEHVELYTKQIPEFEYRMKVRGGLTGYAQVYGKYNTTAYDKLKLDLMYIQNYSLLLDIEIIFKTVKILFVKESTEGFSECESKSIHETACGEISTYVESSKK
ncbi:sugar transferase [bacterium D16-54]|nr:sugar transferase [bacterium D16-54]RKJ14868.1 sugar transferase [bacterium D16-56]